MGDSSSELVVAVVALVVSFVALSATFMQVLQQYYASASGYTQCNEQVMGAWARTKSRNFIWEELRFEVQFDAPVIFVSPPSNRYGPILGAPIAFLDGTQKSLDETCDMAEMDPHKEYEAKTVKERIHTADNERASWLVLLCAVQRMEAKSRDWQQWRHEQQRRHEPPRPLGDVAEEGRVLPPPPSLAESHTLVVALQRKRKSWDTMPPSMSKPYATTTMCHLVEMMAALGVYWKQFDRKHDRYRAEGNGFVVLGERLRELGLVFSFQVYGECRFEGNRVMPVDYVKELCFGYVPTIYRETLDRRRLRAPCDELRDLGSLQMASRSEIAETLVVIGCNKNTVQYFLDGHGKTAHLFPLSFEILGMLSRTFHIENTYYTYIPNPTPDRWDERSLSLIKMMEAYEELSEVPLAGVPRNETLQLGLAQHARAIIRHHGDGDKAAGFLLRALHAALDDTDEILTAKPTTPHGTSSGLSDKAAAPMEKQRQRREMVQDVLRSHIQEVLRLMNERDDQGSDSHSLVVPQKAPASPSSGRSRLPSVAESAPPRFAEIYEEGPEYRQHKYMEVYFQVVRRNVVPRATESTIRRASFTGKCGVHRRCSSNVADGPPGLRLGKHGTGGTRASAAAHRRGDSGSTTQTAHHLLDVDVDEPEEGATSRPGHEELPRQHSAVRESEKESRPRLEDDVGLKTTQVTQVPLADQNVSHDDVWCTLVFRMICWLMLHDFNLQDVQVSKSELMGSRMPVYIA
ncbi:hypothetical protein RJ55_03813 [Drechmeria coniospora]|nr:hypothetical protein RJ55_03813 [Drechmeria coniospora]